MKQTYLKESFIVRSFFSLFFHNMALLQGLVVITTGAKSKYACCSHSKKPRVLITTLASFELFDVLPCSFSPDNSVNLCLVNHYVVCI